MTARTVLLVRHAKAKSRDEGLDDLQRPLTKAGRKALEATLVPVAKLAKEQRTRQRASPPLPYGRARPYAPARPLSR